jgi:VCBS repeat-containing protein
MKKKQPPVRRQSRRLRVEKLESRIVLDGNVQAAVRGKSLNIQGDGSDNEITITYGANVFTVASRDGSTTINGQAGPLNFTGVKKDLNIVMGNGADVVEFDGGSDPNDAIWIRNRLNIDMGSGADQLLMTNVHMLRLAANLGTGNDLLNAGDDGANPGILVTKEANIVASSGTDDVRLANSTFKKFVNLDLGGNNDELTIQNTTVRKRSNFNGGAGTDTLNRENNSGPMRFISFETVNNSVTSPAPLPPVANNDTASVVRNASQSINVAANDTAPGSSINNASITITQNPTHGTAVANSNGTVTYTNNGDAATTDTFQYTIKNADGTTSNAATVNITVTSAALTAANDTGSLTEDATPNTVTGNVLSNDTGGTGAKTVTKVNGQAASVATTVNGQFGTFKINADGSFTYTLDNTNATVNALNNGSTALTDSMAYTASAGGVDSNATLTITINGHTDLVVAADTASITEDATSNTATGNVLTNDTSAGAKTVTAVNGSAASVATNVNGQFGTFKINADGSFTYTLDNTNATVNALNNNSTPLTDSMGYTASDGTQSLSSTLTVTINGHTDLAVAADTASITEDATPNTVTGNVLTNDTSGGTKTVTAVNGQAANVNTNVNGQFGTFHINADGTYTYTLDNTNATVNALNNASTPLTDSMPYTAADGAQSLSSTLTVTINGHTDLTVTADTASITEDATPNTATGNVLTNDTSASGTKTVTAVNGQAANVNTNVNGQFGTFHINADGTYTYTLDNTNATVNALNNASTPLTDSMPYTANDGTQSLSSTLTVTIHGHTDLTVTADTASITEDATPNTVTGNVLTNDASASGTKTVSAVNGQAAGVDADVPGQFGTFHIKADGSYTYTLDNTNATVNALNNASTPLTDSMAYTANDGTQSLSSTLTVTINGHTDLTVSADAGSITEDATPNTTTGNVLTNDTSASGTKTVTAVNGQAAGVDADVPGQFGTFHIKADGSYTYTLDNNNATVNGLDNNSTPLTDSMPYTANDGTQSLSSTLTITINGHTELDAVNDTGFSVTEDSGVDATGNVIDNDTGGNGTKSVSAVKGVATNVGIDVPGTHGTFHIASTGAFTYTLDDTDTAVNDLNDGETLSDSIDYTLTDGIATDTATLTITINGHTDP